ncbi:DUF998 domain-containing protein [Pseudonocardia sp. TRM90224]|uniref:DUF998 domain-containing protein n=1 Tax=Pseudonocardia sp. TRM90224 TaxID=2812678 RepID=UPI001E6565B0|nr:DUF998 domain-containing protein [Pseudonocardia sp. TRM90224]
MTTPLAPRLAAISPAHLATAGFAVAGVIIVMLDVQQPAEAVTNTISAYATSAVKALYVAALLATCVGVTAAVARAGRAVIASRPADLLLLTLWPLGIAVATVFDEQVNTLPGTIHNVAVGTAIVAVHLAAVRMGRRFMSWLLLPTAAAGFACMGVLLGLIIVGTVTGADLPVGVAERVLVAVSGVLVIGTLYGLQRHAAPWRV